MKMARRRRAGHVIRLNDSEMSKRIMNYNPEEKSRAGKPKERWIDGVDNDMRTAGVRNLRMKAKGRNGWRRILEEAKAYL
jgi:hypothetical protein